MYLFQYKVFIPFEQNQWQDVFLFDLVWVLYTDGHYSQVILWGSAKSQVGIHFQVPNIYAKDNGFNMWLDSSSSILQADSVPLWHEFKFKDVHWKTIDVSLRQCHKRTWGFMVEDMKPIQCVEGGQNVSQTRILKWYFW